MKTNFMETLESILKDIPDFYARKGGKWIRKQHTDVDGKILHTLDVCDGSQWHEISNVTEFKKTQ